MPTLNLAYIAELILKYARKYAYALSVTFFFTLVIGMFSSFVASFFVFYNLINNFIAHLNSGASGEMVSKMYGLMNCVGLIQAFDNTKSILLGGALFLLWRILFGQVIRAYQLIINAVKPLVK